MAIFIFVVSSIVLLLMILRFVQPEILYWLRRAVAGVRRNKLFLCADEEVQLSPKDYIELSINDLRPEGVPKGTSEVLYRVTKIRELFSLLDLSRDDIQDIPTAHRSNICIIELSNMVSALARDIQPTSRVPPQVVRADEILRSIAMARSGPTDLALATDEAISIHFRETPISIEQINELLIAVIYGVTYRLTSQQERSTSENHL